jgi:pyrroloquinoline-quinone synthase
MSQDAVEPPSTLVAAVDQTLAASGLLENAYLTRLREGRMPLAAFARSQRQFYFAVDFFSRPMAALLMRLPRPESRLGILANVVEEHGDFQASAFHEATFRQFLSACGEPDPPQAAEAGPAVQAFNATLLGTCLQDDLAMGIASLGIIEHAFATISAVIGRAVVQQGWVPSERLVHYALHAEIDEQHAADFFRLLEEDWDDLGRQPIVRRGFRLGAYAFHRLYEDLLDVA